MTKAKLILLALVISAKCFAQTTVTRTVQANLDTLVTTTSVSSVTLKYKPPVVTSPNPGGTVIASTTYSNQSNINLTNRTINGGTLVFNNCTNVVVNLCIFNGLTGKNLYAVTFNNCTNVTCTNNFGTMYCKFVMVKGGSTINISNNQYLNLYEPVVYNGDFAHAIQFNGVTGAGNQIVNNTIENVPGQCVNPHDVINLVNCVGTSTSHVLVKGNRIRGGMINDNFGKGTGAGITLDNGTYIDVVGNIGVNPGAAFIQANTYNGGTHTNVLIDGNTTVSLIKSNVAADGYVALGSKTNVTISNNKANWINKNGKTGTNFPGGEVLMWFGGSANPAGIKLINNSFDQALTPAVLPDKLLTYHL